MTRLGGSPLDDETVEALEDQVLRLLEPSGAASRAHQDPDPVRRVARRILQRLDGMGKWGGYHTAFDHLARGFAGHDRALAYAVGEALLEAGPPGAEAERGPAPRLPEPEAKRRHPPPDRRRRAAARADAPAGGRLTSGCA